MGFHKYIRKRIIHLTVNNLVKFLQYCLLKIDKFPDSHRTDYRGMKEELQRTFWRELISEHGMETSWEKFQGRH